MLRAGELVTPGKVWKAGTSIQDRQGRRSECAVAYRPLQGRTRPVLLVPMRGSQGSLGFVGPGGELGLNRTPASCRPGTRVGADELVTIAEGQPPG